VHSETSTGVLNPIAELAGVVSDFDGVLLAVDGVTSVGGTRIDFENWGVDFMLTGSQKALALPPGLAFAVASDRALSRAESTPDRGYYFDLVEFDRRAREHATTNTPAVSLLYALQYQLGRIAEEGLDERFARHERMARRTAEWTEELAVTTGRRLEVLAPAGYRSPTVTAISLPEGTSGPAVVGSLADEGITIAPGYGKLKESVIRIGHMGDHTEDELEVVLDATAAVLGAVEHGTIETATAHGGS
ncbi:MAG: pyridoxal-phosphate-dependent aminotransferase family protein, partial [Gemmatimonadota bacterium]